MKLIQKAEEKGFRFRCVQGSAAVEVTALCYDSRRVESGCLFVCMRGANFDSHEILAEIAAAGARAAVIDRDCALPEGLAVFRVGNSRVALAELSAAWFDFPAEKLITVGVTGTKGKTTTSHMLKTLLEAAGKKTGLIGTNGITIGTHHTATKNTTPESYEIQAALAGMLREGCSCAVMEVSSQGLMLHRTGGICFDYGVFMNISPDHIGPNEHGSFEEYLRWKSALFRQCRTGLVNADDPHAAEIIKNAECERLYRFGERAAADFMLRGLRCASEKGFVGLEFDFLSPGRAPLPVQVGIPGRFNAENALAALSVSSLIGAEQEALAQGLRNIRVNGRMELVISEPFTVLVDYAHNAVSMEALLDTLREYHPRRLIVVFGCGGNRAKERRYAMGEIGGKKADLSILTADNSRDERVEDILSDIRGSLEKTGGAYLEIPDRREAIFHAVERAETGDMIAVIGKGHEDYQEIRGLRQHFLDREVVEEALRARFGEQRA
ncbi:MAG: UDP-N-acetylmuramoyl-L-alanyl-D-glutamate--2,6-diaminopimelate ligase [Stomatobaculum sp.]